MWRPFHQEISIWIRLDSVIYSTKTAYGTGAMSTKASQLDTDPLKYKMFADWKNIAVVMAEPARSVAD